MKSHLLRRMLLVVPFLCASPGLALAHPGGPALHGWSAGFMHPLHGLDHMAVMVAVGAWAAHRGGKAVWAMPLAFLSVMTLGGIVGVSHVAIPGAEVMIGASVIVMGLLVLTRARMNLKAGLGLVSLFAFFHGYAHGTEMPDVASLWSYGLGFLTATALLHLLGVIVALGIMRLLTAYRRKVTSRALSHIL